MKRHTEILIIGGGQMGLCTAYSLAKKGAKEVTILEQNYLGYGGSSRCGTGIRQQYAREDRVIMGRESLHIWEQISDELGYDVHFVQKGYVYALYDMEWVEKYRNFAKMHNRLGVPTRIVPTSELKEIIPMLNTEGVVAGIYNPTDAKVDPFAAISAYGLACKRKGVQIHQKTKVISIKEQKNGNYLVSTNNGDIECEILIITAGPWSTLIGDMLEIKIPIKPFIEEVLITEPVEIGVLGPMLNIKTPKYDETWITQTTVNGGLIFGWGHLQWVPEDKISYDMTTSTSYARLACWNLARALPAMANVNVVRHFSGFFDVTPDREPIVLQIPGKRIYVSMAAGIMHAPISGLAISEMILDGACTCIPIEFCNITRFYGEVQPEPIPY